MKTIFVIISLISSSLTPVVAQKKDREGWEPVRALMYASPEVQMRLARRYHIEEGRWIVALMTIRCDDCDRAAKKLEARTDAEHTIIFVPAPKAPTLRWQRQLGLKKVRVVAMSDAEYQQWGITLLPTIVEMQNGRAVRAREDAPQQ